MKIAAAQLDVRLGDIEFNQSRIIELVGNATAAGAGLVLAFLLGGIFARRDGDSRKSHVRTAAYSTSISRFGLTRILLSCCLTIHAQPEDIAARGSLERWT
ncbi:MAG: hypothetical protein P8N76_28595 [Pirellulaceae bacterium]|nr:hypothetical protein [Pirellulaceae bacterium]